MFNNILKTKFKEILFQQFKGSKKAKLRTRYNQVPHLTQDITHGKLIKHREKMQEPLKRMALLSNKGSDEHAQSH